MVKEKEIKHFYKKFDLEKHSKKYKRTAPNELPFIIKNIKGKRKILDLACGFGRFSIPLSKKGYDVYGVDISKNLIQKAKEKAKKEKLKIEFKYGTFLKIPYKKEEFEAVIIIWTAFCHLLNKKDQINALKEIKRVSKNEGIIIIDVPYYTKKNKVKIFKGQGLETKIFMFNKKRLKEISKKAGFKKINIITRMKGNKKRNWLILKK
jgi:ubiquinone/menaquinone biosynthesis C-methylase UbiE